MRTAHRGPTLIALRARREALEIARDVVYPHLEAPSTQLPLPEVETAAESGLRLQLDLEADDDGVPIASYYVEPPARWMWGLLASCLAFVGIVGYVILHSV